MCFHQTWPSLCEFLSCLSPKTSPLCAFVRALAPEVSLLEVISWSSLTKHEPPVCIFHRLDLFDAWLCRVLHRKRAPFCEVLGASYQNAPYLADFSSFSCQTMPNLTGNPPEVCLMPNQNTSRPLVYVIAACFWRCARPESAAVFRVVIRSLQPACLVVAEDRGRSPPLSQDPRRSWFKRLADENIAQERPARARVHARSP